MYDEKRLKELRQKAEEKAMDINDKLANTGEQSVQQLLHELNVHQIELEMQNEDLMRSHQILADAKDMFLNLYENAPVAYIVVNEQGFIGMANDRFYEMLGLKRTENIRKKPLSEYIHQDDLNLFYSVYKPFYNSPESHKFELKFTSGQDVVHTVVSGSKYPRVLNLQKDMFGFDLLMTIYDVTDKVRLEDELNKKNKFLEEINSKLQVQVDHETAQRIRHEQLLFEQKKFADMGEMLSCIAHQWRQPLNVLSLILQTMKVSKEKGIEEDMDELTDTGFEVLKYLSETINDFRDFFKPSKDQQHFNIVEATFYAIRLIKKQMEESGIELSLSCRCDDEETFSENLEEMPACYHKAASIFGFENEYKQVLLNLLQNAKDAIVDKMGAAGGRIAVRIDNMADGVAVTVADNGGGISAGIADKIFEPYFTTKNDLNGTGIGLYMCKSIIDKHFKGKINFENVKDGAVFSIILPK